MAGSTARLSLWRIAGADRNLSARERVRRMNVPAPSIVQASVRKGFSSLSDLLFIPTESPHLRKLCRH